MDVVKLIDEFGLPVIMSIGMGYFIYYIWKFVSYTLKPEIGKMHMALIRVIDQTRMLDQDLICLQQKVDVLLEYKENEKKRKQIKQPSK